MIIAGDGIIGEVLRERDKLLFIGSFQDQPVQWELTVELIARLPINDIQKHKLCGMLKKQVWPLRWLYHLQKMMW